jgi:hypothetical protein
MNPPQSALFQWRTDLHLSQIDAGKMLRPPVSQAAWAAWETGAKPPSLHNAFELERVTGGKIRASEWAKKPSRRRRKPSTQQAKHG